MTDRPDLSGDAQPAPAGPSDSDVQNLANDLRLRRRKERSPEDTQKNDKWLAKQADGLGTTPDHVEDVMVGAITSDVHALPDF